MGNAKRNSSGPKRRFYGNRFTKEGAGGGQEEHVELGAEEEVQATGSSSSEKLQDLSFDEWDTSESDSPAVKSQLIAVAVLFLLRSMTHGKHCIISLTVQLTILVLLLLWRVLLL